jgi:hypothetical protein
VLLPAGRQDDASPAAAPALAEEARLDEPNAPRRSGASSPA